MAKGIWDKFTGLASSAWEGLKSVGGWLKDKAAAAWEGAKAIAGDAWEAAKGLATSAWDGLKTAGSWVKDKAAAVFDGVKDLAARAWDGITNVVSKAWDGLKGAAGKLWDSAKGIAGKLWDGAKGLAGKATGALAKGGAAVAGVASSAFKWIGGKLFGSDDEASEEDNVVEASSEEIPAANSGIEKEPSATDTSADMLNVFRSATADLNVVKDQSIETKDIFKDNRY